ncbi:MAG: hypothetical protein ABEJ78_09900 [Haloferacaceae archaeon]
MVTVRAQAHTLEAVAAGIVLLASVVFALQVTAVTPLSASTSNQHIENQQLATGEGVLTAASENGALERAVRYWNPTTGSFPNLPPEAAYTTTRQVNNTTLGRMLVRAFEPRGVIFNVYFAYQTTSGIERRQFIYRGEASDHAVTATRTVTLYDDEVLYDEDERPTSNTVNGTGSFYAPSTSSTGLYNVVRVEVVLWRM